MATISEVIGAVQAFAAAPFHEGTCYFPQHPKFESILGVLICHRPNGWYMTGDGMLATLSPMQLAAHIYRHQETH